MARLTVGVIVTGSAINSRTVKVVLVIVGAESASDRLVKR